MRDGKLFVRIVLLFTLCLLARQSHAHVKILTPSSHPLALVFTHHNGNIQKAHLRSPEGTRPLEHLEGLQLLSDSSFFLCADSDMLDDLVWRIDFLDPGNEEKLSLWITSVTEVSTAWLALAPTGSSFWEKLPPLPNNRKDAFLYIAPRLPMYRELEQRGGPDVLTFIYTMILTKNGPKLVSIPDIYKKLLPLTSLFCKGQEDEFSRAAYCALYKDFERMAQGGMPSREAMDNFLWKRILTVRWKR